MMAFFVTLVVICVVTFARAGCFTVIRRGRLTRFVAVCFAIRMSTATLSDTTYNKEAHQYCHNGSGKTSYTLKC